MDWFERLTGFREQSYDATRSQLRVDGHELCSLANGRRYGIGTLEPVSLAELRSRAADAGGLPGRLRIGIVQGDVRKLHQAPAHAGALFQVASQFNLLEMSSPEVTPEHGVTRYQADPTQGPACAIAAGAATIFRNYFAPLDGTHGQTVERQFDGLADVGAALSAALDRPLGQLWSMRNGYAMCTQTGLDAIAAHVQSADSPLASRLGSRLRIGVHWDVEVTEAPEPARQRVSQAFCSALPVAYSSVPRSHWQVFASLVLRAAYEATLWAAVCNAQRGQSNQVLLTRLGGGAFGNDDSWIHGAMRAALRQIQDFALDVRLVSYGPPSAELLAIVDEFCRPV
jgi:hypothetical protein